MIPEICYLAIPAKLIVGEEHFLDSRQSEPLLVPCEIAD